MLRDVGSFIFIISIPFVFVIIIDLTLLLLFLIVFVMNGDAIRNYKLLASHRISQIKREPYSVL